MKYIDFYHYFKDKPLINLADIKNIEPDFDSRRLYEWQKNGYLKKINNNFYLFADQKISESHLLYIANQLYSPSYISLEYVLAYYSLIPETVYQLTSVTTRKTKKIENDLGAFNYNNCKSDLFFGYSVIQAKQNFSYKIAEPEKAVLDLLYLRKDLADKDSLIELRINSGIFKEKIDSDRLAKYQKAYNSKTINKKIDNLLAIL